MRCPVDGTTLELAERTGVEIDYCPQCRGVWLDRGGLDRTVERSAGDYGSDRGHDDHRRYSHDDNHERRHHDDDHERRRHDDDHERRHHDDEEYTTSRYGRSGRKRGGAFTALTDLLGGGD